MNHILKPTLFLDRDGVINMFRKDKYVHSVSDFEFIEGSFQAFSIFKNHFSPIVVVTNQAGVGYGYLRRSDLDTIHEHMLAEIKKYGGHVNRVYYCPDRVSKAAPCRKPNSGMALQAQRDFPHIKFDNSWMVGDMDSDITFGNQLNMRTVRVVNEHIDQAVNSNIQADYYFSNLLEFAMWFNLKNKSN